MKKFIKKQAFTLAEVLITLSIIGVVAAITIPSLVTNLDLDRKQAEATIKKTITSIDGATKQIVIKESSSHNMGSVGCSDAKCLRDLYGKYLSYIRVCDAGAQDACLQGAPAASADDPDVAMLIQPVYAGAAPSSINFTGKPLAVLADGTLIGFDYYPNCLLTTTSLIDFKGQSKHVYDTCAAVTVDTNGPKKPNAVGRDRYQIPVGKLGVKIQQ